MIIGEKSPSYFIYWLINCQCDRYHVVGAVLSVCHIFYFYFFLYHFWRHSSLNTPRSIKNRKNTLRYSSINQVSAHVILVCTVPVFPLTVVLYDNQEDMISLNTFEKHHTVLI